MIYVSISERPAVAYSPAYCFTHTHCKDRICTDKPNGRTTCCWTSAGYTVCQTCTLNTSTGYYDNCSSVSNFSSGGVSGTDTSPPSVAPPKVCPDGSAPDANGQCPPVTQGPKETSSSTDQGIIQPPDDTHSSKPKPPRNDDLLTGPPSEDTKSSKHKLPKADELISPSGNQGVK